MNNLDRLKGLSLHPTTDTAAGFTGDEGALGTRGMTYSGEGLTPTDNDLDNWYNPLLDNAVQQIIREVETMRHLGLLRPFVEGEAVGACPRRVLPKQVTDTQVAKFHKRRKEDDRASMLALRKRNDATMKSLLEAR